MNNTGFVHDSIELRRLIAENPELPIIVLAGQSASSEDYSWQYCLCVSCEVTIILDCETPFRDDHIYNDEDDFKEDLADYLLEYYSNEFKGLSDEEFEKRLDEEAAKYEPYWKEVIAIYADN